jgi:hypothetical protein
VQLCEAQEHFARYVEGNQEPLPQFWGRTGPLIQRSLAMIEVQFKKNMRVLHHHRAQILNVNSTSWHSQYTK